MMIVWETQKGIKILVLPNSFYLFILFIEQNVQNICLIKLGLLILSTSLSFSDTLLQGAYIIFQKMLIIFQNSVDNFEVAPNTY